MSDAIDSLKFLRFITAVAEIMKTYLNCGKEPYLYYYRDKDAKEIDIVLEHDGVLNPIEII